MLLLLTSVAVAGCAPTPKPDWCDTNEAQRPTESEWAVMGDERRREIVVHNEYGADLCGWEP